MFNNKSKITYNNGVIETAGSVPKYHGIYYVGNGVIRSFAITDSDDVPFVSVSSQYTSDISNVVWYRILQYVNMYIGADYVTLEGGNRLVFHPECTDEYTETELQFIYTLLTECVVTPKDFSRILLFNGLDNVLTQQHWVSIINYICALPSHDVCILPSILEDLGINNSSMIKDMAEVHFQPRKN